MTPIPSYSIFSWQPTVVTRPHITAMVRPQEGGATPAAIAADLNALDPGKRVLCPNYGNDIYTNASDKLDSTHYGIWPTAGVASVKARMTTLFSGIASAGGHIDHLAMDLEAGFPFDEPSLTLILADSRFAALQLIPPLTLSGLLNSYTEQDRWIYLTSSLHTDYHNEAVYRPLRANFPNATMSQYFTAVCPLHLGQPDEWGEIISGPKCPGNFQAPQFYGISRGSNQGTRHPGPDYSLPFTQVGLVANRCRASSWGPTPSVAWVAFKSSTSDNGSPIPWGGTSWYEEAMYHIWLSGAKSLMFFNPHENSGATSNDELVLSNVTAEVSDLANGSPFNTLLTDRVMNLTGRTWFATIGKTRAGKIIGRVTFHPDHTGRVIVKAGSFNHRVSPPQSGHGVWITGW
jgi:hypothetical protein